MPLANADPTKLPAAARQKLHWASFNALGVAAFTAGQHYADPETGRPVTSLGSRYHEYDTGNCTHPWGTNGDQYTAYVIDLTGLGYLQDLQRGADGVVSVSNERRTPYNWNGELVGSFSRNAATPQIGYFFFTDPDTVTNVLHRFSTAYAGASYNAATDLRDTGFFPKSFTLVANQHPVWVQTDSSDRWVVFNVGNGVSVDTYAWDSQTNTTLIVTGAQANTYAGGIGIANESHYQKDGRYVYIVMGPDGGGAGDGLHLCWDLTTDTVSGPLTYHLSHSAASAGYTVGPDDFGTHFDYRYYVPAPQAGGRAASPVAQTGTWFTGFNTILQYGGHNSADWVVGGAADGPVASRFFVTDCDAPTGRHDAHDGQDPTFETEYPPGSGLFPPPFSPGPVWALDAGSVYKTTITYGGYNESVDNPISDVWVWDAGGTKIVDQLTLAASRGAMTAGTFFVSGTTVYVWRADSLQPNDTTRKLTAKHTRLISDGVGFIRLDGGALYYLCGAYNNYAGYYSQPQAALSLDGRLVFFHQNLGDTANGINTFRRSYVVSVPLADTVGGTATHLALSVQPAGAVSGVALTVQPVVLVEDSGNATVTGDSSTVTATVLTGAGVTITSGATKAAVAGIASFAGLTLTALATTTGVVLRFSDGALTVVDSAPFTVTVTPPPTTDPTAPAPAVFRMARGRAVFAGFRRMVRALLGWLTLSSSLA